MEFQKLSSTRATTTFAIRCNQALIATVLRDFPLSSRVTYGFIVLKLFDAHCLVDSTYHGVAVVIEPNFF